MSSSSSSFNSFWNNRNRLHPSSSWAWYDFKYPISCMLECSYLSMPPLKIFRVLSNSLSCFRRMLLTFDVVSMICDEDTSLTKVRLVICDRWFLMWGYSDCKLSLVTMQRNVVNVYFARKVILSERDTFYCENKVIGYRCWWLSNYGETLPGSVPPTNGLRLFEGDAPDVTDFVGVIHFRCWVWCDDAALCGHW